MWGKWWSYAFIGLVFKSGACAIVGCNFYCYRGFDLVLCSG